MQLNIDLALFGRDVMKNPGLGLCRVTRAERGSFLTVDSHRTLFPTRRQHHPLCNARSPPSFLHF